MQPWAEKHHYSFRPPDFAISMRAEIPAGRQTDPVVGHEKPVRRPLESAAHVPHVGSGVQEVRRSGVCFRVELEFGVRVSVWVRVCLEHDARGGALNLSLLVGVSSS